MAIKYTAAQHEAIFVRGTNVLVSAGAGSGKTAVLTERVLRRLIEGDKVESLVILTFTNAAAKEMKERIRDKITGALKTYPHLSEALKNLDTAHIQTFDSLALFMLKKYGYLINVSKDLTIGDPVRMRLAKETIAEAMLDVLYKENDEAFLALLSTFTHRDDGQVKDQIIFFYEALALHYDREDLEHLIETHAFDYAHFSMLFESFEKRVIEHVHALKETLKEARDFHGEDVSIMHMRALDEAFSSLLSCETYDAVYAVITDGIKVPTTHKVTSKLKENFEEELAVVKAIHEDVKARFNDVLALVQKSRESHFESYQKCKPHAQTMVRLVKEFKARYEAYQIKHEQFDFQTVARFALDIVRKNHEVRDELKRSIAEVMVDEYQDTNNMQEAFVLSITDQNMYMVGDIKQSIYRFRHAEPSIFIDKYTMYQKNKGGLLIDLNENFRSREEVLTGINTVFSSVMDAEVGGVDYTGNQQLLYGNKSYDSLNDPQTSYGMRVNTYDLAKYQDFFKEEVGRDAAEFFAVANDILARVGRDSVADKGVLRKSEFGDYALLIDRKTQFDLAKQVFEYVGVPLEVHRSESLMAFDDTLVFKNLCVLLAALDDEALFQAHFKHAFMSVVRSFLCEADEDSIARQVMQLPRYSRDLKVKVLPEFEAFFNTLYGVRDVMEERTLEALLHALIEAFSFREKVLKLPRAHLALYRIDYLLSLSESMSNEGMHIHEFVAMLITMLDQGLDLEINESKPLSLDTVHLMTIHKSKGLEFPFVYFPHLYKPFNKSKMRNYDFDRRLGILQLHEDEGLEKSFLYPLLSLMEKEESMSELMRVLYVALSRAKEGFSLYLGLDASKDKSYRVDEDDKIIKHERLKYPNFESVFKSVLDRLAPYVHTLEFEDLAMDLDYLKTQSKQSINVPQEEKVYAHIDDLEEVCEQKTLSHGVETLLESSSQENLALGDRIHQLLEWIDFFKPLDEEIKQYTHDAFEAKLVQNFFNQPFMQSLKLINVYKEFPFVKEDSGSVIKGYIDCLLETEDKFIVVDYKLKDIENPVYLDQVRGYIEVIKERTKKEVQGVLYSLLEGRFKDVTLLP